MVLCDTSWEESTQKNCGVRLEAEREETLNLEH